jgi:hypothetical protein
VDQTQERTPVSSKPHQPAETREHHGPVTDQAGDTREAEHERPTEGDHETESDEMNENHSAGVMIALSIFLPAAATEHGNPQPTSDNPDALMVTIEAASGSTQITVGPMTGQALQQQPIEPGTEQPQAAVEPTIGGKESSGSMAAPTGTPGIPSDGPATVAQTAAVPAAQPVSEPATLPSGMPLDEKAESKKAPSPSSNRTVQASDAPVERNPGSGVEVTQQIDHPGADLMVDQRGSSEWSPSAGGHDEAMGQRDDQQAGGRTDTLQPGRHAAPREGFGDTVAAMTGDRTTSPGGGDSRTSASSLTGRAAHVSWPNGNEARPAIQAVSLNLEPADLGPVNVRIFMTDRTVHAHIRTDHMDLGQGMLSQQQQLETKLQSSGLEMGEFKVTVDHQQLSRGDSQGWLGHQGDRRPATVELVQRAGEGTAHDPSPIERRRHTGILSFFA